MADNKEQKSNKPRKTKDLAKLGVNKILLILNGIVFALFCLQVAGFFSSYSKKTDLLFSQGRIINLDPKTGELNLSDISEEEFSLKRSQSKSANATQKEVKPEDFIGPMPANTEQEKKVEAEPAKPAKPIDYKAANLAIIVTEVGPINETYELARTLPREVTFAFSPYSDNLQKKIDNTIKESRFALVNLMMQPANFPIKDSGPLSIQVNYDENQNIGRFEKTAKLASSFGGMLSSTDEVVTSKFDKLAPILKKFSEKNLFFGYYKGTNNLSVENDAKPLAADIFGVDYLVDSDPTPEEIEAVLNQVKEDLVVKKKKVIIAIRAYPKSIEAIKKWLDANLGENISIAPINYFVTNN